MKFDLQPTLRDRKERAVIIGNTFLERAYWGRSFNLELKTMMLDHAFKFVDRVYFEIGANNIRSQIAIRRIRAAFFTRKQLPLFDGTLSDMVVFAIDRP